MEDFEPYQIWLLMAASAYIGYLFGRRTQWSPEERQHQRMLEAERIDKAIASLTPDQRLKIESLLHEKKKIEAIREMRAATGLGLKDAKHAVERMSGQ